MKAKIFILLTAASALISGVGCSGEAYDPSDNNPSAVAESETEEKTQPKTEKPTEAPTKAPTEPPTKAPTEPPTEKTTEPPTEALSASTIRTEVKEAIDAYEKFMDDYLAFMSNYNSLSYSDSLSLMADYTKFLEDYATNVAKFDALDSDLTQAEEVYYTEVGLRVTAKLLQFEASLASDAVTDSGDWEFDLDADRDTDWDAGWDDSDFDDFNFDFDF